MPDPVPWAEVEAAARRVFDAPAADRAQVLIDVCGTNPVLRRQVEALLRADIESGDFLESPVRLDAVVSASNSPVDTQAIDLPVIPGYRLIREVGRGGGGKVYLAESLREPGRSSQQVAVKVLDDETAGEVVRARFDQERQLLRLLDHRNVAALIDGGATEAGTPYFVMEYVDGQPITTYCDERRLGISERVRLFLDACRVVGYAHRNGILHRDIKPSNVMVSIHAEVKLLDFGIAKWVADTPLPDSEVPLTRTRERVMTPQYASPEQIRGGVLSPASDVFSLGIILYELLTGRHPFVSTSWSIGETERLILAARCLPASESAGSVIDVVDASGASARLHPDVVAAARGTDVATLVDTLRGSLDAIVARALASDPTNRYASADLLGGDLDKFRRGDSTSGARYGWTTRLLRRFQFPVGPRRLGPAAYHESDRATAREARRADALSRFMVSMFERAAPSKARGAGVTAGEVLDWAAENVDEELSEELDARIDVLTNLGRIFNEMGESEKAVTVLTRSLDARRRHYGADDFRLLDTLKWLGTAQAALDDFEAASMNLGQALSISREVYGEHHLDVATRLNDLAIIKSRGGDAVEAKRLYQESLAIKHGQLPDDDPRILSTMNNLGVLLQRMGHTKESEHILWQVVAARKRAYGEESVYVAMSLHNVMVCRRRRGDVRGAEPLAFDVLELRVRLLGADHPDTLSSSYNLACILRDLRRFDEADTRFREVYADYVATRGVEHPETLAVAVGHAMLRGLRKPIGEAVAEHAMEAASAHRRMEAALGADHLMSLNTKLEVARLWMFAGQSAVAEPLIRHVLAHREERMGADCPVAHEARLVLGRAMAEMGNMDESRTLLKSALIALEGEWDPDHPEILQTRDVLKRR